MSGRLIPVSQLAEHERASTSGQGIWMQAALYLGVGALNALLGYACFCLLFQLFSSYVNYLVILTISNVIYMGFAFFSNRRLVFRSKDPVLAQSLRYYAVYAVCVAANYAVMIILVEWHSMKPMIAQIPATILSVALGFTGNRIFTFR